MKTEAEKQIPKGYWPDSQGNLVPVAKIKPIDKLRTKTVMELCDLAKQHSVSLARFKGNIMARIQDFLDQSYSEFDVKIGGKKGNVTLLSFDGRYKVVRQIAEHITFDERLQVARELIHECIRGWGKTANRNIMALVEHAFQVDKQGKINTARVLGLRRLDIVDERWERAMDAISESIKITGTKPYVRLYELNDETGKYDPISLDFASV